jgi:hypothetical protein
MKNYLILFWRDYFLFTKLQIGSEIQKIKDHLSD